MGFLDNLLKRETRRIISGAVDSVVDNVIDSIRGDKGTTVTDNSSSVRYNKNGKPRENETGDDAHCRSDVNTIRRRIEMVAAEDWPGYELRRDIPATELGAGEKDHGFDYGLYLDGQPKLMIMILNPSQYRNLSVDNAHMACKKRGVRSFHLLKHLPNRKTYIAERMKSLMPQ